MPKMVGESHNEPLTNLQVITMANGRRTKECKHPQIGEIIALYCSDCRIWIHGKEFVIWEKTTDEYYTANWTIPDWPVNSRTEFNKCCQCHAVGAVQSKYQPDKTIPIQWICAGCKKHVCFNCALTIPSSIPIEFYESTLCSKECWRRVGCPKD